MDADEVKEVVKNVVKDVAEQEAMNALKEVGADELKALVTQAVDDKIVELQEDSATSESWWIKIRNRFEIMMLKTSITTIMQEVEQQLVKM